MSAPVFVRIRNVPRDYAWGIPGGISRALGTGSTSAPEAELWLGAHPLSPSLVVDGPWHDLAQWETESGQRLPYLLKLLAADRALSLQAHPTEERARAGYAAEQAAGIPITSPDRNYKDPYAKPELIVAVEDGFEALCGFRPVQEAQAEITPLAAAADCPAPFRRWRDLIGAEGPREAMRWLLSGAQDARKLVADLPQAAQTDPGRFELVQRLSLQYPGDPGIAIALMLNHVTLRAGECLWLPAGNIHAYLCGLGVELMGPSDNVLRGGLTPKHVDVTELLEVLDVGTGPAPFLPPTSEEPGVQLYRPASMPSGSEVPFELRRIVDTVVVRTQSPAILLVLQGSFELDVDGEQAEAHRGDAFFVPDPRELRLVGSGLAFLASAN